MIGVNISENAGATPWFGVDTTPDCSLGKVGVLVCTACSTTVFEPGSALAKLIVGPPRGLELAAGVIIEEGAAVLAAADPAITCPNFGIPRFGEAVISSFE